MKHFIYASIIAMGCTVAVAAQAGTAADQAKDKMAPAKDAAATVTLSGCVAESAGSFTLTNATMADKPGAPMSYSLTGGTLKPHVGHKVEVTGTMKPAAADSMKKDPAAKDSAMAKEGAMAKDKMAKEGMKSDMPMGAVAVKSLKMVAATCP